MLFEIFSLKPEMKRFLVFSVSCLILAVACVLFVHAFNKEAKAQGGSYFRVVGQTVGNAPMVAVGENVYQLIGNPPRWCTLPQCLSAPPPVPMSSCVFYNNYFAITDSGEGFVRGDRDVWYSVGLVPNGTSVQSETWSGVKEKYR